MLGAVLPLALLTTSQQATAADSSGRNDDAQTSAVAAGDAEGLRDSDRSKWNILLGAGALNESRYPGSRIDYTRGLPVVSINYARFFLGGVPGGGGPAGFGAYLLRTEHWAVGLDAGGDTRKPRRASDAPILHGWGNIPGTVRGGMFASYSTEWFSARGNVSLGGHHEGVMASFSAEAKYHATSRLTLSIGPELVWVNQQYAMTFFGLDAAQSEIAGIAPYRASAGVNRVGAAAGANYVVTRHWSLAAHVSYGRLEGDAANSPVTTDKLQWVYGAFVVYRF
jgi:outer membrane protein